MEHDLYLVLPRVNHSTGIHGLKLVSQIKRATPNQTPGFLSKIHAYFSSGNTIYISLNCQSNHIRCSQTTPGGLFQTSSVYRPVEFHPFQKFSFLHIVAGPFSGISRHSSKVSSVLNVCRTGLSGDP